MTANKLFCTACKEVALKKSIIDLHVKSEKHTKGKERLADKDKREQDIVKALNDIRKCILLVRCCLKINVCSE